MRLPPPRGAAWRRDVASFEKNPLQDFGARTVFVTKARKVYGTTAPPRP